MIFINYSKEKRHFTRREKILFVVLVFIIIGLAGYNVFKASLPYYLKWYAVNGPLIKSDLENFCIHLGKNCDLNKHCEVIIHPSSTDEPNARIKVGFKEPSRVIESMGIAQPWYECSLKREYMTEEMCVGDENWFYEGKCLSYGEFLKENGGF